MIRTGRAILVGVISFVLAVLLVGVPFATAAATKPSWEINAIAFPTSFNNADGRDEVTEVVSAATGGSYELQALGARDAPVTVPIAWDATAAAMQQALEAATQDSGVRVSGGEAGGSGVRTYTITWSGSLSGQEVVPTVVENELTGGEITVTAVQRPSYSDQYLEYVVNRSTQTTEGLVTVVDTPPSQVAVVKARLMQRVGETKEGECVVTQVVTCTYAHPVLPNEELLLELSTAVADPEYIGSTANQIEVSTATSSRTATVPAGVNTGPAPFGISTFSFEADGTDGAPYLQADGHPASVTVTANLNTDVTPGVPVPGVAQDPRAFTVELPVGFVGNPLTTERCPETDITSEEGGNLGEQRTECPPSTQVGLVRFEDALGQHGEGFPLYNIAPPKGYPAELGFNAGIGQPIFLFATLVPSPSGYRIRLSEPAVIRAERPRGFSTTVFANPQEHNGSDTGKATAFVTNPSRCSAEPLNAKFEATSWEGSSDTAETTAYPGIEGCSLVTGISGFSPTLSVTPEETQVDTPSGYTFDVKIPQTVDAEDLGTPALKNTTVTLPPGLAIDPAIAGGPNALAGCTPGQIDLEGTELGDGWAGGNGSPYEDGLLHPSPGDCPENSRLGTVEIHTPILTEPLTGHVFLAQPTCGGAGQPECTEAAAEEGKIFGLYLEAAGAGAIIKLPGSVEVGGYGAHSQQTGLAPGQVRARFDDSPQFPVDDVKLVFPGGQRAQLSNPQTCGTATTNSSLEPWSAPESGPNATPISAFTVTGCPSTEPFAPAFAAGSVTPGAGEYRPFTLALTRQDGEQSLSALSVQMPAGLVGKLASVTPCGEVQASQGTCGPESLVGHSQVASGAGTEPLWVTGSVYLTGPYKGGPFGLSIVTPAKAGPFNLGNVVTRAAIHIDPNTAAVSVISDPLPQLVDGLPLRIKTIDVTIDRPGFTLNPTNCAQKPVTGAITGALPNGAQGSTVAVASPFAVAGCKNLPFKPSFKASTQAKTSKTGGAALTVKVLPVAGNANIAKVSLELPRQLPARLTTLQKACTEAQFDTNPAGCPVASVIGSAKAITPILKSPLVGPAYLVSHGGAAFPDVQFILQGEGIEIVLDGKTQIKKGITYSHFETVPDAPISSFETVLPEGSHSILATDIPTKAKNNLCGLALNMPTSITGQNGATITQTTKIAITGCAKKKTLTRAQKLTAALKACKKRAKSKRAGCEASARKKYGVLKKAKKKQ
jgi:hypothetical protein